jgi:hypothetical protein
MRFGIEIRFVGGEFPNGRLAHDEVTGRSPAFGGVNFDETGLQRRGLATEEQPLDTGIQIAKGPRRKARTRGLINWALVQQPDYQSQLRSTTTSRVRQVGIAGATYAGAGAMYTRGAGLTTTGAVYTGGGAT